MAAVYMEILEKIFLKAKKIMRWKTFLTCLILQEAHLHQLSNTSVNGSVQIKYETHYLSINIVKL